MYLKHITFLCTAIISLAIVSKAQIATSFSFGSILSSSTAGSNFSGPIVIDGKNPCYTVKNGVPLFEVSHLSVGKFIMNCETSNSSDFVFEVFPNPVISYAQIYVKGKVNINDKFELTLYNSKGERLHTTTGLLGQFLSGLRLSLSNHTDGSYFVKIKSLNTDKTLKLIKIKN